MTAREDEVLRQAGYLVDAGRYDEARRMLQKLLAGPVTEETRRQVEAFLPRIP